jgi:hypothetical protein
MDPVPDEHAQTYLYYQAMISARHAKISFKRAAA